jgi:hypothetical protein
MGINCLCNFIPKCIEFSRAIRESMDLCFIDKKMVLKTFHAVELRGKIIKNFIHSYKNPIFQLNT